MTDHFEMSAGVYIDKEVPVVIYRDGVRIEIGKGHINDKGVFLTEFNDSEESQKLYEMLTKGQLFSLPVTISEVTCKEE